MSTVTVAAVQFASTASVQKNLATAADMSRKASDQGAKIAVLPENVAIMGINDTDKLAHAEVEGTGPIQDCLAEIASANKIWLVSGTIPLRAAGGKVYASSLVYDDGGHCVGRYDKIHLFDVDVPNSEEQYRESATIAAGDRPLVLDTPFGRLGVIICYDLRFPELTRQMADSGMDILVVPAAFTARTGAAHWELLLRARAVENLCYVIASGQGGVHENGRETYGNSLVVDPWGSLLTRLGTEPGLAIAAIDLMQLQRVRQSFPALSHRRIESVRLNLASQHSVEKFAANK